MHIIFHIKLTRNYLILIILRRTNEKWNLAGFSLNSGNDMAEDPVYNTYRYALRNANGEFRGRSVDFYADAYVMFALNSKNAPTLASEAAVALNMWMAVVDKLYDTVHDCKENSNNPNSLKKDGGVHTLDEAAAFWIGDSQVTGDPYQGHLLYAFTEKIGEIFNQDAGGQTEVNRRLMRLFNEAKDQITFANACTVQSNTHVKLKHIVDEMVSVMSIPLLQSLIHGLFSNDHERVQLYAVSIVPLIAGCNPNTYAILREKLIDNFYKAVEFDEVFKLLQSTYQCLGISCDDLGTYQQTGSLSCTDPLPLSPIGSYTPSFDVHQV